MSYMLNVLIAGDQLLNAALGGYPDETLSARAHRLAQRGQKLWLERTINVLFFWQPNHCQAAYESERRRRHQPAEYRA